MYIGSTCETLGQIMSKHRHRFKQQERPQDLIYQHMHELDVDNVYIELIEHYSCNDIYELRAREGHFIRHIGTLNKQIAGRTRK